MTVAAEEIVTAACGARIVVRVSGCHVALTERDVSGIAIRMTEIFKFAPDQAARLAALFLRAAPLAEAGEAEGLRAEVAHRRKVVAGEEARIAAIERRLGEIETVAHAPDPAPSPG